MLLSSVSYAKTSCLQETDLWTNVFYTEQVRLYPKNTAYYPSWTTYEDGYTNKGIEAVVGVKNAKTIYEIYGEECEDLHFFDIENTKSFEKFIADDMQTQVKVTDVKEWNGFLFVAVYAPKGATQEKSYTDYNGISKTYVEAVRNKSGYDSYLYVFDISLNENYGKARYTKINKDEIGVTGANTVIEFVNVTDDYIVVSSKNGYNNASNQRGIIILNNTIKRGEEFSPEFANGVSSLKIIQKSGDSRDWFNDYQTTIIGNTRILWYTKSTEMASGTQINQRVFYLTDISGGAVGETVDFYTANTYGNGLNDILTCPLEGGWSADISPKIEAVANKDNKFYFLVSYAFEGNNYIALYKTDWSNPYAPKLEGTVNYTFNGADISKSKNLYRYEDKIYFSYDNGIDVLDSSLNYMGTIYYADMFSETPTGGIQLFVVDNYMYAWFGIGPTMYDVKVKLDDNNTYVLESVVGQTAKQKPINSMVFYGDKVYIPSCNQSPAMYKPNVVKVDYSKTVPVRLDVLEPPMELAVPYIIKGTAYNIDHIIVDDNGEQRIIEATQGEDGTMNWEYKVKTDGVHNITFTGALGTDYIIDGTSETVEFTAYSENVSGLSAEYTENEGFLTVEIINPDNIKGMFVTAVYIGDEMSKVISGDLTNGNTQNIVIPTDGKYTAKTFFIDDIGTMRALKSAVIK